MPQFNILGAPIVLLSKIGDVEIDMVEETVVTHDTLVTKHPTETGRNITDHVVNLPVVITISGRFVDSPLAGFGGIATFFNPLQALSSAIASGLTGGRAVELWRTLEELRATKQPVDVLLQQRLYEGMVFKSLSAPRRVGDGGSMRFSAEMHEIITTRTSVVGDDEFGGFAVSVDHTAPDPYGLGTVGAIL